LEIYGYTREEVVGDTPRLFSSGEHEKSFYKELWNTILRGKNYHNVIINQKKNGELIHVDTKITPVKDERGENISYFPVTARDVTQRILSEQKFKKLATIDPLTQIPNRYQIYQYFDDFIAQKKRKESSFSVLLFDIDHFKQINDNFGHYVGDRILQNFSSLIAENIRSVDKFGRWGGEEFLLLLDDTNEHEAMRIGQKLNRLVGRTVFDDLYCITVSIGVTEYRKDDTKEKCIERADMALYAAKNLGRNRVVFN
jgi:diguanylate cyclase (GGDEF)-like protein/PAS domain S-box-containing protein